MKILVWQWGRFGAGPRFATELARAFSRLAGTTGMLSLSAQAELLDSRSPPASALTVSTYNGMPSLLGKLATSPLLARTLARELARLRPDTAICAMPAPLDFLMAGALERQKIPFGVVIHDAAPHPGDGFPLQFALQRRLARRAGLLVALSTHVAEQLREVAAGRSARLVIASHPPFAFGPVAAREVHAGRPLRLLFFGRLLRYKGLDLLAAALARLPPDRFSVRIVGRGPPSDALHALASLAFVKVENRWVPEGEIASLLRWADALVLPYREASQSGVAATAVAAGRMVVATAVGGLSEQLRDEPLALLAPPEPAALAACLARIAEHPIPAPTAAMADGAWMAFAERVLPELRALAGAA
ncbi:MAG: glycosyltransferase [Acetobacteraceae bacterium]